MKLVLRYLADQCVFIIAYLGIILLFCLTFFLYDIPLAVYLDAVLFSFFFLFLLLVVLFCNYLNAHRKRVEGIKGPSLYVKKKTSTSHLVEAEYEALLQALDSEYRMEIERLERANNELLDYYSMWSHQIKTPLAVINLKMQENELDQSILKQELMKVDQYLEMMLQYLRMNHSMNDLVFEKVNLNDLVKKTVKRYATFFIYKNITLNLELLEKIIISDEKWLQFVLEQVLFNAIKYTNEGRIFIYLNPENSEELVIEDTGIGILPQDISRVFEKGYTGFNGRINQKASGLGLFMSEKVMKQLGHQLHLTSEVGVGTKVFFSFAQASYLVE